MLQPAHHTDPSSLVSNVPQEIALVLRKALCSLVEDLSHPGWRGRREREVVSLFCFGHLVPLIRPDSFLHDATQIGIEVPVPQLLDQPRRNSTTTTKRQVCKDIVIWPGAKMTCWDDEGAPTVTPACIIEWKHNQETTSRRDIDWLRKYSSGFPGFTGLAVLTSALEGKLFSLSCTKVFGGEAQPAWLELP